MSPAPLARLRSLDGLRGIAAVVVLVHHSLLTLPALAAPYRDGQAVPAPAGWLVHTPLHLAWAGTEAVYLFFVLSGMVLAMSTNSRTFNWNSYYPSRLVRLYVPVLGAVLLAAVVIAVFPRGGEAESWWLADRPDEYSVTSMLTDLTLVGGASDVISPLWSLQWEVLFSLLLPVYIYVGRRLRPGVQLVVYTALAALGVWGDVRALTYLPMFGIGVALAGAWDALSQWSDRAEVRRSARWWSVPAMLGGLALMVSYWMLLPALGEWARVATIVPTLVGVVLVIVASAFGRPIAGLLGSAPFRFLGSISFSLYLVHEPIVIAVAALLPRPAFTLLIAAPISIALAIGFYYAVERPSHRFARRVRADAQHRLVLVA